MYRTRSQILNAVTLIKIEDQDNIVLELRAVGAPPFIKEKNRRRGGIVRTMENRLDRQLVGRRLRKQGLKKAGGRLSSAIRAPAAPCRSRGPTPPEVRS